MVIGGGGTMTREAAILGIPSVSFFMGKRGAVDDALRGMDRLVMVENEDDIAGITLSRGTRLDRLTNSRALETIVDSILNFR
jgi:predicted glycosyltransferase